MVYNRDALLDDELMKSEAAGSSIALPPVLTLDSDVPQEKWLLKKKTPHWTSLLSSLDGKQCQCKDTQATLIWAPLQKMLLARYDNAGEDKVATLTQYELDAGSSRKNQISRWKWDDGPDECRRNLRSHPNHRR